MISWNIGVRGIPRLESIKPFGFARSSSIVIVIMNVSGISGSPSQPFKTQ